MGAEFTKLKQKGNNTHNVDIAYDYRFFLDYLNDNIHKDCLKYMQPYKILPKENDRQVLTHYFANVSNEELNKYSKAVDINPSLRCYCLDGLVINYLFQADDNKNNDTESLMIDSIKSVLIDNDNVALSEGLFGMNQIYQLPFHHILMYLSSEINDDIQRHIMDKYENKSNHLNHEMIFELLKYNALRNESQSNYQLLKKMMTFHQNKNDKLSLKYIPMIAMYKNENDILLIQSLLNHGPANKSWFAAMNGIQYFPHAAFWDYLMKFFKKIYKHISIVNGETVPMALGQIDDKFGEEEKDEFKQEKKQELLSEGQPEDEGNDNFEEKDEYKNDDNIDYNLLIDEAQFYDVTTQMQFIKTLCSFGVYNAMKYEEKVCASIHHLLDIPKANTNNGYYEDNMRLLLQCIALDASMKSIICRIWKVYGICDWRYVNVLICEPTQTKLGFREFLLGTHKKIGKDSNILSIAGERGILQNIYSFLKDGICAEAIQLLQNRDNIVWWSPILEDGEHIMAILESINNLFDVLVNTKNKYRFVLYEQFKQIHNSRVVEKFVFSKFDALLVQKHKPIF